MRRGYEFGEDRFELPLVLGGAYQRLATAFTDYRKRTEDILREHFGHKFGKDAYLQFGSERREVSLRCLAADAISLYAMHDDVLPAHDGIRRALFVTVQLFQGGEPFVAPEDVGLACDDSTRNLYTLPLAPELPPSLVSSSRVQSHLTVEQWSSMPKIMLGEEDCSQLVATAEGMHPIIMLRDPGPDGLEMAV